MKKIDQYLLEHYPTIWNTKIVWVILASIPVHILFFMIGYLSFLNPENLQNESFNDFYFDNGISFIHFIISILMLVVWLVMMFKNNAFKNFYPSNKIKLFLQLVQYVLIVLVITSFYFSFLLGVKILVNTKYNEEQFNKEIDIINMARPFLSQGYSQYTPFYNKNFPKKLGTIYCETEYDKIIPNQPYIKDYNNFYQFYTTYQKVIRIRYDKNTEPIREYPNGITTDKIIEDRDTSDSTAILTIKDKVIDALPYIKTPKLSYRHYSNLFSENLSYHYYYTDERFTGNANEELSRKFNQLLDRKNPKEIETLLDNFLKISNKYKIKHNLTTQDWFKIVYHPDGFEVKNFIKTDKNSNFATASNEDVITVDSATTAVLDSAQTPKSEHDYKSKIIKELNPNIDNEVSYENYYSQYLLNLYYNTNDLASLVSNVEKIRTYTDYNELFCFNFWVAFGIAMVVFCFRVMGLRPLLFSIVSAGVLLLFIALITIGIGIGGNGDIGIMLFLFIVGLFIIIMSFTQIFGKLANAIFIHLTLVGFIPWVLLILGMITKYQEDICEAEQNKLKIDETYICDSLLNNLGVGGTSLVLILIGGIFYYFYTSILHQWKASAEQ